jgi:hypothetical protein
LFFIFFFPSKNDGDRWSGSIAQLKDLSFTPLSSLGRCCVFLPKFALIKRAMMNEQVDWQERKSDRANLSGWTTQVDWVRNIGPPYTQHTHRADGCGVSRGGTITSAGFYYYWSGARAEQRVRRRRPGSRCFCYWQRKWIEEPSAQDPPLGSFDKTLLLLL